MCPQCILILEISIADRSWPVLMARGEGVSLQLHLLRKPEVVHEELNDVLQPVGEMIYSMAELLVPIGGKKPFVWGKPGELQIQVLLLEYFNVKRNTFS